MTEKTGVWEPLRDHCPQVCWERIENLVSTGTADVNGCLHGVECWIETKMVKGNRITFQPMQPAWLLKRMRAGGRVFVLARKGDDLLLYRGNGLWALLHSVVQKKNGDLVADYRAGGFVEFVKPHDWGELLRHLFTYPNTLVANQKLHLERKAA